ncbi:MAG: type pilus assembly protein PilN [Candidatus Atribacteria bacterium]|nr:type pilus assembly protein PilN [Candidatus Atribacteria bacterium]
MELKSAYPVKINLLPRRYIIKRTPNWVRLFFIVVLIVFSFLSFSFYINLHIKTSSLENDIESLKLQLANLKEREKKMEEVQAQINVVEERVNTLKYLIQSEPDWLKIVYTLGGCMPRDLHWDKASFNPSSFNCEGKVYSIFSLAQFIASLDQNRDLFPQVDFNSLTLEEGGVYHFTLSGRFKTP